MMLQKIKHPLVGNFFSLVLLQCVNYALPLITVPYLFRVLNVSNYGLINFANAFIQYFMVFTDFGYNLSAVKLVAENRGDTHKLSDIFNRVMFSKFLLLLIGLVVMLSVVFYFDKFSSDKTLYILSYGMVLGSVLFPVWFFMGMEKMKFITIITIITRSLALIPIFVFVKKSDDYLLVPLINSAGAILSGIIGIVVVKKVFKLKYAVPTFKEMMHSLKDSSQYFLSRVSVSVYTISNVFTLGLFSNTTMVGYYSAAEKLFLALQNAYVPVNNSLYPYMTKTKNVTVYKKIFSFLTIANTLLIIGMLFYTNDIIYLIYKITDKESIIVLQLLLVACLLIIPSILLGYPFLGAMGYSKYTNKSVITSSIFHLCGLFFLVLTNQLSIYTVAGMLIITEGVVCGIRAWGAYKFKLFKPIKTT
ncbi:MAG: oligosaccharide flippase family protein [Bacteroidetes bacterium]|nr:oligosaccharide flippase family protein [Bacteroidota bacterium]